MVQDKGYKVRFKSNDVEFEIEGDKSFVEEQVKVLQEASQAAMAYSRPGAGGYGLARRRRTVHTEVSPEIVNQLEIFLRDSRPKGSPDVALAAGYFLQKDGSVKQFSTRDLTMILEPIRGVTVGNMSLAVRRAVEREYLTEHKRPEGGRSTYSVSDKGVERIQNGFI